MINKKKSIGTKWDGKSRVSNEMYRKNYDEIFKKNLEGTVINIGESFKSREYTTEEQKLLDKVEERNGF